MIEGVPRDAHGLPDAPRGVVASMPGLYFVGMPFQYGLTSQLLGGVGRDAGYVVGRIATTQRAARARRSAKIARTLARQDCTWSTESDRVRTPVQTVRPAARWGTAKGTLV